ncbi:SMI1/KNR4 family protein [Yinghuangia soli]|uniref:SMI1/KNR4 family protein n=1 Tax=Yinghuangia soli TaxID=2908204 RepID=A0AA41PWC8_9ACTN|nr:SMI1/KNR4 family protein [Yinghuangia soli]MCF2525747.1 SMI1/KNR4 family protein [Yinghuangia soli]
MNDWLGQLVSLVGRVPEARGPADWAAVEAELGLDLPQDYKAFADVFGAGVFNNYLAVFVPDTGAGLVRQVESFGSLMGNPMYRSMFAPYPTYPSDGGILPMGASEAGDSFYWLPGDQGNWSILGRTEDEPDWHRFDMSTTEFVFKIASGADMGMFSLNVGEMAPSFMPITRSWGEEVPWDADWDEQFPMSG